MESLRKTTATVRQAGEPEKHPVHSTNRVSRYRFFLIGILFAICLLLPTLDQFFKFSAAFKSTEKNVLTPLPTFHFPRVLSYINGFNQYYKENFGWRNTLFYQYSQFKYYVLGVSPLPHKVVLGKNGWFYPGNDLANVKNQHLGLDPLSLETLALIAQKLRDKQQQLAAQGIKFYFVVAPDSYTIYPENLPDYMQNLSITSNLDRLKTYLATHTNVPFIDVRPALLAAKSTHQAYMQTDTHWNNYGCLVATIAITQRIRQDFPALPNPSEKDYSIVPIKGYSGDLVVMMALNQDLTDSINYHTIPPPPMGYREIERIPNPAGGWPSQRFTGSIAKAPGLLFMGDSFTLSLAETLPSYFSTAYVTQSDTIRTDLVRSEKPDVVVFEIVERNLARLVNL
jgi:alginate O-acetyltransferase complex protein AlgJ